METGVEKGKPKRVSVACAECKRRRIRCSDAIPCTECATHDRPCIYDELADKRRKVAAKHTHDELQYYRGFLDQLLQAIRQGERAAIDGIIDIIRAGAPEDDILRAVAHCLSQCPNVDTEGTGTRIGDLSPRVANMGLDILNENLIRDMEYRSWQ